MDTYLANRDKAAFLKIIQRMLQELEEGDGFGEGTLAELAALYKRMAYERQGECLRFVYEVLEDSYFAEIYFMSALLWKLQDRRILFYIKTLLESGGYPLWRRLNDACQMQIFLFNNQILRRDEGYQHLRHIYETFLNEIKAKIPYFYPYIPWAERKKKIVIIMSTVLNVSHAPTAWLRFIYCCLERMGYDVECFVCHFLGAESYWNGVFLNNNFMHDTGPFEYMLEEVKIKGYNLELHEEDYIEGLYQTAWKIWKEKPEYVLEIGSETMLAGLCSEFTTTVSMGMTSALPVTNAQILVLLVEESQKRRMLWKMLLEEEQTVLTVRLALYELETDQSDGEYKKETFGIPENRFVVILAGNRLDVEVREAFEEILFQILAQKEDLAVAVIGDCPRLKKRMTESEWAERFYFLGQQADFRKAIGIGDVFLNPPRHGGGTGGLFAILEGVPVITLGNCDVEVTSGKEFVCGSMEEMPALIRRYYMDLEFMWKQKENCRKRAEEKTSFDNEKALWEICRMAKEHTLERERREGFDTL